MKRLIKLGMRAGIQEKDMVKDFVALVSSSIKQGQECLV
jgi:hypothetical protein